MSYPLVIGNTKLVLFFTSAIKNFSDQNLVFVEFNQKCAFGSILISFLITDVFLESIKPLSFISFANSQLSRGTQMKSILVHKTKNSLSLGVGDYCSIISQNIEEEIMKLITISLLLLCIIALSSLLDGCRNSWSD